MPMSAKSKPASAAGRGGGGGGEADSSAAASTAAAASAPSVPPSPSGGGVRRHKPGGGAGGAGGGGGGGVGGGSGSSSVDPWSVSLALDMAVGASVAVDMVSLIVARSCDKLTEHYAQQCAMENTARLAVEAVMQAIEWQLLGHDDGEKLSVRSLLASQPAAAESASAAAAAAGASADSAYAEGSSYAPTEPAPSPITEPHDRRRPALDAIASRLSLPSPYNQLWTCEAEPVPADLDRWARGVIPTKVTPPPPPIVLGLSDSMGSIGGAALTGAFTVHEVDETAASAAPAHPRSATHSATPSRMHSHTSSHSHVLRSPSQGLGGGGTQGGGAAGRKTAAEQAAELVALKAASQPFRVDNPPSKEEVVREKQRELELRRLEKKKRIAAEAAAIRAADDAERARLERIQSELRGRNYTFDNRGNAILVAPAPHETFPALHPAPIVRVKEVFLTEEEEAEIAKREKRNRFKKGAPANTQTMASSVTAVPQQQQPEEKQQSSSRSHDPHHGGGSKSKKGGGKKSSRIDVEGFLDQNTTQLNLLQSLTLSKGVTLKQGALSKTFDPRLSSGAAGGLDGGGGGGGVDHAQAELQGLTRSEYMKRLEERRVVDSSFLPSVAAAQQQQQPARVLVGSPGVSLSRSSSSRNALAASAAASAAAASATAGADGASPRGSTSNLHGDGADELEWGPPDSAAAAAVAASAASAAPAAAASATGAHAHKQPHHRRVTSGDAFNASIATDPSWGLNHSQGAARLMGGGGGGRDGRGGRDGGQVPRPPQPHKPSEADRLAAVGRRSRNPRDRAHIDTIGSQVGLRQHLPPAPLGKTTGHGLMMLHGETHTSVAGSSAASEVGSRVQSAAVRSSASPTRPFAKVPAVPATITATDKAKLYFL